MCLQYIFLLVRFFFLSMLVGHKSITLNLMFSYATTSKDCSIPNRKARTNKTRKILSIIRAILKKNKTCAINDPLGQTHSLASSDHYFLLFCFAIFEKWGRTDERTDNMCKNNDHYRPALWVGRVDQFTV